MKIKSKEAPVQRAVLDYLRLRGIACWRINSGAIRDKTGRPVKMAPAGFADVVGILPGGRFLAVEVKRPGGLSGLTELQRAFLSRIRHEGGVGIVVDDVRTLVNLLEAIESDPDTEFSIYGDIA